MGGVGKRERWTDRLGQRVGPHASVGVRDHDVGDLREQSLEVDEQTVEALNVARVRPVDQAQPFVDLLENQLMRLEDLHGVFVEDSRRPLDPMDGGLDDVAAVLVGGETEQDQRQQDRNEQQADGREGHAAATSLSLRSWVGGWSLGHGRGLGRHSKICAQSRCRNKGVGGRRTRSGRGRHDPVEFALWIAPRTVAPRRGRAAGAPFPQPPDREWNQHKDMLQDR